MSALLEFLASYDAAALIAASSKGVVTRAEKDAATGKVSLDAQENGEARLTLGREAVTLTAKGLNACRCTCPATGTCRHIVAAILFLRDNAGTKPANVADNAEPQIGQPGFTLGEVERFARGDWPHALALTEARAEILPGTSPVIRFTETGERVTFPGGQPLSEALFKGPRGTRRRRVIAAAALVLLRQSGIALPEHVAPAPRTRAVDFRLLELAQTALRQAALALASGQVLAAGNRLFTIAISARAEAVPRLAAELRGLSERLDPDRLRHAEDRPELLLMAIARSYALTEALRHSPDDTVLTGKLSRSFSPQGQRKLICLSAEHWHTPSGARGFSIILFDPESGRFHSATEARAAGTDPLFSPERLWHQGFWNIGTPPSFSGHEILFDDLLMAADGAISLTQTARLGTVTSLACLREHEAVIRSREELSSYRSRERGVGLRRKSGQVFALVSPKETAIPEKDAIRQVNSWTWFDETDDPLTLILPPEARPGSEPVEVELGLVAIGGPNSLRLLAVWPAGADRPLSLQNQHLPQRQPGWRKALSNQIPHPMPPSSRRGPIQDPLGRWFDRATEAVLIRLAQRAGEWPPALIREAEALGLHSIGNLLRASETGPLSPEMALRLAYMLDQTRQQA